MALAPDVASIFTAEKTEMHVCNKRGKKKAFLFQIRIMYNTVAILRLYYTICVISQVKFRDILAVFIRKKMSELYRFSCGIFQCVFWFSSYSVFHFSRLIDEHLRCPLEGHLYIFGPLGVGIPQQR